MFHKVNLKDLKELDPNLAWSLLATEISEKFFSGTLLTVPTIDEANYFDLMVCFSKKKKNILKTITGTNADFRLHGHFLDLAVEGKLDEELIEVMRNPLEEDLNIESNSFSWTDGGSKSVTIRLDGMKKYVMNWNVEGDLVIDHEKLDLRNESVYVISEVVYARQVTVEVQIYYTKNVYHFHDQIPVGFSYLKFPVDRTGTLQPAKDTKINLDAVFEPVEDESKGKH